MPQIVIVKGAIGARETCHVGSGHLTVDDFKELFNEYYVIDPKELVGVSLPAWQVMSILGDRGYSVVSTVAATGNVKEFVWTLQK